MKTSITRQKVMRAFLLLVVLIIASWICRLVLDIDQEHSLDYVQNATSRTDPSWLPSTIAQVSGIVVGLLITASFIRHRGLLLAGVAVVGILVVYFNVVYLATIPERGPNLRLARVGMAGFIAWLLPSAFLIMVFLLPESEDEEEIPEHDGSENDRDSEEDGSEPAGPPQTQDAVDDQAPRVSPDQ